MRTTLLPLALVAAAIAGDRGANPPQRSNRDSAGTQAAPAIQILDSNFTKIVIVRLRNGVDLLDGLKKAVAEKGIKNAAILSGIGSLTSYSIHVVDNVTFPPKEAFPKGEGPQDLINVNGYVMDGRVHAHITFSDQKAALGGHLEPGTRIFTFAVITLGVLDDKTSLAGFDAWQ
jgi:predicted DNA-binding protein with PD1-like motif